MKISTIIGAALSNLIDVRMGSGAVCVTTKQYEALAFADDTSASFRCGRMGDVSYVRLWLSTTGGGANKHNTFHWRIGRLTFSCMTEADNMACHKEFERGQARRKAA